MFPFPVSFEKQLPNGEVVKVLKKVNFHLCVDKFFLKFTEFPKISEIYEVGSVCHMCLGDCVVTLLRAVKGIISSNHFSYLVVIEFSELSEATKGKLKRLSFRSNDFFKKFKYFFRHFRTFIEPIDSDTWPVDMLFLITTRNTEIAVRTRELIRRTWANETKLLPLKTKRVFVLGKK